MNYLYLKHSSWLLGLKINDDQSSYKMYKKFMKFKLTELPKSVQISKSASQKRDPGRMTLLKRLW